MQQQLFFKSTRSFQSNPRIPIERGYTTITYKGAGLPYERLSARGLGGDFAGSRFNQVRKANAVCLLGGKSCRERQQITPATLLRGLLHHGLEVAAVLEREKRREL